MQEIRRIKRLLGRIAVLVVAALPVVLALTYPGSGWFEQLRSWTQRSPRTAVRERPRPGPVGAPITVTPERPLGNDSSVSPVPLRLILARTQPGRNNSEGFAQIGVNARTPQTYRGGAILANGARLSEIHTNYIILRRDGRSVRLDLAGHGGAVSAEPARDILTVGGGNPESPAHGNSKDPFTDYLRPSPVFLGSQLHGLVLYAGRYQDPFFKFGLEPGDVLTQINGVPIGNASEALASLHSLLRGAALTVDIERQGVSQTLSLDGAILVQAIASGPSPARAWSRAAGTHAFDAPSSIGVTSHWGGL